MSTSGQIFQGSPKCQAFAWATGSPMQPAKGPREWKEEKREEEGLDEGAALKGKQK